MHHSKGWSPSFPALSRAVSSICCTLCPSIFQLATDNKPVWNKGGLSGIHSEAHGYSWRQDKGSRDPSCIGGVNSAGWHDHAGGWTDRGYPRMYGLPLRCCMSSGASELGLERMGLHLLRLSKEEWEERCRDWKLQYHPNLFCEEPENILQVVYSSGGELAVPTVKQFFLGLGLRHYEYMNIIKEAKSMQAKTLDRRITKMMESFLTMGLTKEQIVMALKGAPLLLETNPEVVTAALRWFETELRMERKEVLSTFAHGPRCFREATYVLDSGLKVFQSWGLTHEQLLELVKRKPTVLARDPDDLSNKYEFAKKVLAKDLSDILEYPSYLTISERRITIRVGFYAYMKMDFKAVPLKELYEAHEKEFFNQHSRTQVAKFRKWWKWEREHLRDAVSSGMFMGKMY